MITAYAVLTAAENDFRYILVIWAFQFCDTLLVSVHDQPLLKSGLNYDRLPSIALPATAPSLSSPAHQLSCANTSSPPSRKKQVSSSSKSAPVSPVSTPSHHHALKVSAQDHQLTSFKTDPLDPQTTNAKGVFELANSSSSTSSSRQATESIKKLYDLTFTESQKEDYQKLLDLETLEEEETESLLKEEEEVTTSPGSFLSFRKSFKMSPKRRRESRKHCAKPEGGSPELPHLGSNSSSRRKTTAGSKIEKPRFYLRDILPVLKEKNELKEQVHLLEDEVASLKRYQIFIKAVPSFIVYLVHGITSLIFIVSVEDFALLTPQG